LLKRLRRAGAGIGRHRLLLKGKPSFRLDRGDESTRESAVATSVVKADLGDGVVVGVEVQREEALEEDVSLERALQFGSLAKAIEALTASVIDALRKAQPDRATVELGLDVGVEAGQLTALLVKGSGTATLKVTLEWGGGGG
jgi:NTP-dependent ternary system trypsin peptidase co-occuring protein